MVAASPPRSNVSPYHLQAPPFLALRRFTPDQLDVAPSVLGTESEPRKMP
jgi:hypothetical protein